MALEAWGHRRIEAGEPVEKVLADVIGTGNPPAAYLLVAVDLLLSHWPNRALQPYRFSHVLSFFAFIGTERLTTESRFQLLGLRRCKKEPVGAASLASLKARPSRRWMLDQLLGFMRWANPSKIAMNWLSFSPRGRAAARPKTNQTSETPSSWRFTPSTSSIRRTGARESYKLRTARRKLANTFSRERKAGTSQPMQEAARERQADNAMEAGIRVAFEQPGAIVSGVRGGN